MISWSPSLVLWAARRGGRGRPSRWAAQNTSNSASVHSVFIRTTPTGEPKPGNAAREARSERPVGTPQGRHRTRPGAARREDASSDEPNFLPAAPRLKRAVLESKLWHSALADLDLRPLDGHAGPHLVR
jgi:hypothetical protein